MEWRNRTDERKNGTEEGVQLFENEHMGERGSKWVTLHTVVQCIPIHTYRPHQAGFTPGVCVDG